MRKFPYFSIIWLSFSVLVINGCDNATSRSTDIQRITSLLQEQVSDWNRGDLDSFMDGYWKNDSLRFIGSSGIIYGWDNTLERYKRSYPDRNAMGFLQFDLISVDVLSENSAIVVGKWSLDRDEEDLGGYFTLLFRKIDGHWLIVSDHTS